MERSLLSRLTCNAIRHTASGDGGVIDVTVAATPRAVRIEVTDFGPAPPARQPGASTRVAPPASGTATPEDENGRGLTIVDFLATRWGHYGLAGGQVTAWAELGDPGDAEADPR